MRILLTNDDGIHAPGLRALNEALQPLGEVFVVAPERPRSASGHSITLHKPLRIEETRLPNGQRAWATSGTPADCVTLGLDVVMEGRADLLFSGINEGSNLGWDLTYSGTVAAAIEGAILGLPSVAVSVVENGSELNFEPAARFSRTLAEAIRDNGMERWTLLNVNVPALSLERIRGVTVTHQGRRQYVDRIDRRVDPWGRAYYWLRGSLKEETPDEGSDVHAILENRISVTPIHLDMTAYSLIAPMREWNLG